MRESSVLPKNTMSPAMARTRTAGFGIERTNHETTGPPKYNCKIPIISYEFILVQRKFGCHKFRKWEDEVGENLILIIGR